ncbi:MAG: BrnT family toxin [Spirochaetes bacterium]|nr:BrnT family toxin [Spirochaetota bacterium]
MKHHNWNKDKNEKLKLERNISFEDIVFYINNGHLIEIIDHPNQEKYNGQKIYIIEKDNYIYMCPFVENDHEVFLKTIIPSRKATKEYLGDK